MTSIPTVSALYESSLASALSASGTSFQVVSALDRDGNALTDLYGFVISEGESNEEFVIGTVSGNTVTIVARGLDANDPSVEIAGNKHAHRRGSSVKITDYPILGIMRNILNGEAGYALPNPIRYASGVTPVDALDLVTKAYADALAISGAGLASTGTAGLAEEATQAEIDSDTGSGSVARLFVNPSTLATSKYSIRLPTADEKAAMAGGGDYGTPSGSNKFLTKAFNASATGLPVVKKYVAADSPATWTKPSGLKYVVVEVQAPGGGGGGDDFDDTNAIGSSGGGGGYSKKLIAASALGSSETVTVGAAGTAGNNASSPTAGGNGGNVSFGVHATANGGVGGPVGAPVIADGGTAASGDINIPGGASYGLNAVTGPVLSHGGDSQLGRGGASMATGTAGSSQSDPVGYGGGGAGGVEHTGSSHTSPTAGGPGIVILTEYFS